MKYLSFDKCCWIYFIAVFEGYYDDLVHACGDSTANALE